MKYEEIKSKFILLKREELDYIDNIAKISSNKILLENEKLEIYKTLNNYKIKLNELLTKFREEVISIIVDKKKVKRENLKDVVVEFEIDKKYLSALNFYNEQYKKYVFESLGIDIEDFKFKLTFYDLLYNYNRYSGVDNDVIQNGQRLIEKSIYVFCGYYDSSEDCYGPCLGDADDYLYGVYENICSKYDGRKEINKKQMDEFEKEKIIIHSKRYVHGNEIKKIFEEELLNEKNKTIDDCIIETKNKAEELNYKRSPEYKEKLLLDRINKLCKKISNIEEKNEKDLVIIISITQDKKYLINFKIINRDKLVAEFPLGYINDKEELVECVKKTLKDKYGYITDNLFILDDAYSYLNNSNMYIIVANNCIEVDNNIKEKNYDLFSECELKYLISKNILSDPISKLAYYSLINNTDDCNITYLSDNQKIYKRQKIKINPLDNLK